MRPVLILAPLCLAFVAGATEGRAQETPPTASASTVRTASDPPADPPALQTRDTLVANTVAADTGAPSPRPSFVAVRTDPPGARVYVDSAFAGVAPLVVALPADSARRRGGRRVVAVAGGEAGEWFTPAVVDTIVTAGAGDTLFLGYALPFTARIASDPPGADVLLGDSLLGATPLFVSLPRAATSVRIRKDGYREEPVLIDPATPDYRVALVPREGGPGPSPLAGVTSGVDTKLYVAAAVTIVEGTAAALLKHKADALYRDYQATGDPATLDRVHRYDFASALSLVVAEIGLGYIVIELLSR